MPRRFLAALFTLVAFALARAPLASAAGGAVLGQADGKVQVLLDGVEPWLDAKSGMDITPGSQVKTGKASSAVVLLGDGTKMRIGASAQMTVEDASALNVSVKMLFGRLEAWVKKAQGRTFQVRTAAAVASVRGTVFSVTALSNGSAAIELFTGSLALTDSFGHNLSLSAGHSVSAGGGTGFAAPKALPPSVQAPAEPVIDMKAMKAMAPPPSQKGKPTKPGSPPNEMPADATPPLAPPPPNPAQTRCISTVSPSAPCP